MVKDCFENTLTDIASFHIEKGDRVVFAFNNFNTPRLALGTVENIYYSKINKECACTVQLDEKIGDTEQVRNVYGSRLLKLN